MHPLVQASVIMSPGEDNLQRYVQIMSLILALFPLRSASWKKDIQTNNSSCAYSRPNVSKKLLNHFQTTAQSTRLLNLTKNKHYDIKKRTMIEIFYGPSTVFTNRRYGYSFGYKYTPTQLLAPLKHLIKQFYLFFDQSSST